MIRPDLRKYSVYGKAQQWRLHVRITVIFAIDLSSGRSKSAFQLAPSMHHTPSGFCRWFISGLHRKRNANITKSTSRSIYLFPSFRLFNSILGNWSDQSNLEGRAPSHGCVVYYVLSFYGPSEPKIGSCILVNLLVRNGEWSSSKSLLNRFRAKKVLVKISKLLGQGWQSGQIGEDGQQCPLESQGGGRVGFLCSCRNFLY